MSAVIGVDLSLTSTGMSDGATTWTVTSKPAGRVLVWEIRERLTALVREVVEGMAYPALVVLEGPSLGSATPHTWDRAGAWWLLVDRLADMNVRVAVVPPSVLKKYATGRGNADKGAMADAAARRLPHVETNGQADRVDAAWLAALGIDHLGGPSHVSQSHREVLGKVAWPVARVVA